MSEEIIFPMYEEVRRRIYFSFQQMKKQNSYLQITTNKYQRRYALYNFKQRYLNFMGEIMTSKKLNKLNDEKKNYITKFVYNLDKITARDANKITFICSELLEELGVTNIGYTKKDVFPMA